MELHSIAFCISHNVGLLKEFKQEGRKAKLGIN